MREMENTLKVLLTHAFTHVVLLEHRSSGTQGDLGSLSSLASPARGFLQSGLWLHVSLLALWALSGTVSMCGFYLVPHSEHLHLHPLSAVFYEGFVV